HQRARERDALLVAQTTGELAHEERGLACDEAQRRLGAGADAAQHDRRRAASDQQRTGSFRADVQRLGLRRTAHARAARDREVVVPGVRESTEVALVLGDELVEGERACAAAAVRALAGRVVQIVAREALAEVVVLAREEDELLPRLVDAPREDRKR